MKLLLILLMVSLAACMERTNVKSDPKMKVDSVSFFWTYKDSMTVLEFGLHRENMLYSCTSTRESFTLLYGSVQQKWLYKNSFDSGTMYVEKENAYEENGTWYKVSKLIMNKGLTDGESTYIVEKNAGLLVTKSNTWRYAMFRKTEDPHLAAVIYRVTTDRDFYDNDTTGMSIW